MAWTERPWPNGKTLLGVITCKDDDQWQYILREWDMIERMANVVLVEVGVRGGLAVQRTGWA